MNTNEDDFEDDDFEIDDLFNRKPKKRKRNSKKKGNRGELELCKVLNKRFSPKEFSRTVGSGNRWSHVKYVKKDFLGDIVCPDDFRFVIECKHGYEIDFHYLMERKNKVLDDFLRQADDESRRSGLPSLVCWKKNHCPWIVFIKSEELPKVSDVTFNYGDWTAIALDRFLSQEDEFFFNNYSK